MRACLLLVCWVMMGCGGGRTAERDLSELEAVVRPGDLVFRRGRGVMSRAVLAADHRSVYSHTGIVVGDSGAWRVVHAVPGEAGGDRVKMEPLAVFFSLERARKGAVLRVTDAPSARKAAEHAVALFRRDIPFDHDYDLTDTTEMYCTELIHNVFSRQGIDLTAGKRTRLDVPGFTGEYILPGDLQHGPPLETVYEF